MDIGVKFLWPRRCPCYITDVALSTFAQGNDNVRTRFWCIDSHNQQIQVIFMSKAFREMWGLRHPFSKEEVSKNYISWNAQIKFCLSWNTHKKIFLLKFMGGGAFTLSSLFGSGPQAKLRVLGWSIWDVLSGFETGSFCLRYKVKRSRITWSWATKMLSAHQSTDPRPWAAQPLPVWMQRMTKLGSPMMACRSCPVEIFAADPWTSSSVYLLHYHTDIYDENLQNI